MEKKIKVLVVDDSAVVRQVLKDILESDPLIEVIDTAGDPFIAAEKIRKELPDVILLDVEMPLKLVMISKTITILSFAEYTCTGILFSLSLTDKQNRN